MSQEDASLFFEREIFSFEEHLTGGGSEKMDEEIGIHNTDDRHEENYFMKSEDGQLNFALLANAFEEKHSERLHEFYDRNKVLQGLNCFFLLDNDSVPSAKSSGYSHSVESASIKNGLQKSSRNFLEKISQTVDDIFESSYVNDYPEFPCREDFLLRNLRNYLSLESSQEKQYQQNALPSFFNPQSSQADAYFPSQCHQQQQQQYSQFQKQHVSYFHKIMDSSYQIFLHRLSQLIEQKRISTKTLLPFVCRFSIDLAENLLHFIFKCDNNFTQKIFAQSSSDAYQTANSHADIQHRPFYTQTQEQHFHTHIPPQISENKSELVNDSQIDKKEDITNSTIQKDIQEFPLLEQYDEHINGQSDDVNKGLKGVQCEHDIYFEDQEEDEDCLPFAPSKKVFRKQWNRVESQMLADLYWKHDQKIPGEVLEDLTKIFNRSIQSITSKLQKIRRNSNQPQMMFQQETAPEKRNLFDLNCQNLKQINGNILKNNEGDNQKNLKYTDNVFHNTNYNQNSEPSQYSLNVSPVSQNNNEKSTGQSSKQGTMENKLRVCVCELPGQEGTKSQILKRMKEKYFSTSSNCQQGSWEKSASQMLSSSGIFIKKKGFFTLRDNQEVSSLDIANTHKQKIIYILQNLPDKRGTLQEIVHAFADTFQVEFNSKKLQENISKTLNSYDAFDKSHAKTIYQLHSPQQDAQIQVINLNNNCEQYMSSQTDLQSRCSSHASHRPIPQCFNILYYSLQLFHSSFLIIYLNVNNFNLQDNCEPKRNEVQLFD